MADDATTPPAETPAPQVGPAVAGSAGIDTALLERALTGAEPPKTEEPTEPKKPPPTPEESVRAAMKAVAERTRTPDGKFAPKPAEAPDAATAATTDSQQQAKPTQAQAPVIEPPAAAKGLLKATDWTKLPAPVRDALAKDLAALDSYVSPAAKGDVEFAQAIRQRMASHEPAMKAAGFTSHAQGLDYLFRLQEFASRDLKSYVRWVAQQAGMALAEDPAQSAGSQPAPQQFDPFSHPAVRELAQKVNGLEAQQTQALQAQTDSHINAFSATKDAAGQPAYPHFDAVRAEMGRLIGAGMATDLKDAYEKAVFMDGTLREKVISERSAQRIEAQRTATATARASASPPKGAPGGSPALNGAAAKRGESVEDSIRNALRQAQARA